MPLLELERYLFPETLFEPEDNPVPGPWWVLHTRPRTEKALARKLEAARAPFFLPLHQQQWVNKGRRFTSYLPLFPNYIFVRGDDLWSVLPTTNQVIRALAVPDQEQLAEELSRVHQLMQLGLAVAPEERLLPGTPVLIESGPLAGMQGKVLRHGSRLRFWVEVTFLQRAVSAEGEGGTIRPLGGPPEARRG